MIIPVIITLLFVIVINCNIITSSSCDLSLSTTYSDLSLYSTVPSSFPITLQSSFCKSSLFIDIDNSIDLYLSFEYPYETYNNTIMNDAKSSNVYDQKIERNGGIIVDGIRGRAWKGNGIDENIVFYDCHSKGKDITVAFFIFLEEKDVGTFHYLAQQIGNGGWRLRIGNENGDLKVQVWGDSGGEFLYDPGIFFQWETVYHLTLVIQEVSGSQSRIKVFIDGNLEYSKEDAPHLGGNTNNVYLGGNFPHANFRGWMDEFFLFKRVLSQLEIQNLISFNGSSDITLTKINPEFTNYYACLITEEGLNECTSRIRYRNDVPPQISNFEYTNPHSDYTNNVKVKCDEFKVSFSSDVHTNILFEFNEKNSDDEYSILFEEYNTEHEILLRKLNKNETYEYSITAFDYGGDSALVNEGSFITQCSDELDYIVPTPAKVIYKGDVSLQIDDSWVILTNNDDLFFPAKWLKEKIFVLGAEFDIERILGDGLSSSSFDFAEKTIRIEIISDDVKDFLQSESGFNYPEEKLGEEGYIIETFLEDNFILITANTAKGVFYGTSTLAFLIRHNGLTENVRIIDFPSHKFRGISINDLTRDVHPWNPDTASFATDLFSKRNTLDNLALWKFNKFVIADQVWYYHYQNDNFDLMNAFVGVRDYFKERFIDMIPSTQSYTFTRDRPFHLREGWWHRNCSFTFNPANNDYAELTEPKTGSNLLINGDFSNSLNDWDVNLKSGSITVNDCDGDPCIQILGDSVIEQKFHNVEENEYYHMIVEVKTGSPKTTLNHYDIEGSYFTHWYDHTGKYYSNWKKKTITTRVTYRTDSLGVKLSGEGLYKNVRLLKVNGELINVIRDINTDIEVYSNDYSVKYTENDDYFVENGTISNDGYYFDDLVKFKIKRNPAGTIGENDEVLVNFDSLMEFVTDGLYKQPFVVSDERVYTDIMYPGIDFLLEYLDPEEIFVWGDEAYAWNTDSRNRKRGLSNAELMAEYYNKIQAYIDIRKDDFNSKHDRINIMATADSMNIYNNGGLYTLWRTGGYKGAFQDMLDQKMITKQSAMSLSSWSYQKKSGFYRLLSIFKVYNDNGFHFFSGPGCYVDEGEWLVYQAEVSVDMEYNRGGLQQVFGFSPNDFHYFYKLFAENYWNTKFKYIFVDSFEYHDFDNGRKGPFNWTFCNDLDESEWEDSYLTLSIESNIYWYIEPSWKAGYIDNGMLIDAEHAVCSSYIYVEEETLYSLFVFIRSYSTFSETSEIELKWYNSSMKYISSCFVVLTNQDIDDEVKQHFLECYSPKFSRYCQVALKGGTTERFYFDTVGLKERRRVDGFYDLEGDDDDDDSDSDFSDIYIILIISSVFVFIIVLIILIILIILFLKKKSINNSNLSTIELTQKVGSKCELEEDAVKSSTM